MRIAYIAPYQGKALTLRRPVVRNLSLAGRVKVERIAELLLRAGHDVEVFSQGEVVERGLKLYRAFDDPDPFSERIPVRYASALPVRFLSGFWSSMSTVSAFLNRHRAAPFDVVIIYNLKPPQVACAKRAIGLGLPVILEYEDGAFGKGTTGSEEAQSRLKPTYHINEAKRILNRVSGCIGVSRELLDQTPATIPKLLLRGIVTGEILEACRIRAEPRNNWVVYSGTLFLAYGLEELIAAWKILDLQDWELHIAGHGELTTTLERLAQGCPSIKFHGLLDRSANARLLASAKIGMNAHETGHTSGNVFAFKIVEYLAAGLHVVTTPMGDLPPEINAGITYMADNGENTIVSTLRRVIDTHLYQNTAVSAAISNFGEEAVSRALNRILAEVTSKCISIHG